MTPKEVSLSFTQILVQDNLSFTGHTYWAVFLFAKVLFVRYGIPLSYNHVHQAKNTVGDSSQWRMTLGMYVTIECPSSTNRHLHHSKYLNKRVSDSFQMLVWLVSDGTGFQDLACPKGISAIYFTTFHYNINVLEDRFYVLHSCPQGKKPPNKKSTTFVASTDPSHRLYSNFHFLFKNLRVKTLAFQT